MELKEGVKLEGLQAPILEALATIDEICEERGLEFVVTSTTDGKHMHGSLHYKGLAFDMRSRNFSARQLAGLVVAMREELGRDYQVIVEKDHIHVEYQPRC